MLLSSVRASSTQNEPLPINLTVGDSNGPDFKLLGSQTRAEWIVKFELDLPSFFSLTYSSMRVRGQRKSSAILI